MSEASEMADWQSLPVKRRKAILERSYAVLRKVSTDQIGLLNAFRKDKARYKSERHLYFFTLLKSFWQDADFAVSLGKKSHSSYAAFPVRTMMEKMLKARWFSKQDEQGQDLILKKELLRQCLYLYRLERDKGNLKAQAEYKRQYDSLNNLGLPPIEKVLREEVEPFPSYKMLCKESGLPDAAHLYGTYSLLSGIPHGDFMSMFRTAHQPEGEEFVGVMLYLIRFCAEMLKVCDALIDHQMRSEVQAAIKRADEIRKGK